jgi:hypothetical protein
VGICSRLPIRVSRRLTFEALWFVQHYVFPPSHADLLSVRREYKKQDKREEAQTAIEARQTTIPMPCSRENRNRGS